MDERCSDSKHWKLCRISERNGGGCGRLGREQSRRLAGILPSAGHRLHGDHATDQLLTGMAENQTGSDQ